MDNEKHEIKSTTNSEMGSYHWFHTHMARIKGWAEYAKEHELDDAKKQIMADMIYESSVELIDGYKHINENSVVLGTFNVSGLNDLYKELERLKSLDK